MHNDFKPWNFYKIKDKYLIYDLEHASLEGLPYIDLFNFVVEPRIRSGDEIKSIARAIDKYSKNNLFNLYRENLLLTGSPKKYFISYIASCLKSDLFSDQEKGSLMGLTSLVMQKNIFK